PLPHLHSFPTRRSSDLRSSSTTSPATTGGAVPEERVNALAGASERSRSSSKPYPIATATNTPSLLMLMTSCTRFPGRPVILNVRSEEHTSELQSLAYLV